jgi:hypothetical protein
MFMPAGKYMEIRDAPRKAQVTAATHERTGRAAARAMSSLMTGGTGIGSSKKPNTTFTRKDTKQRSSNSLATEQHRKRRHTRLVRGQVQITSAPRVKAISASAGNFPD